jgi:hypothetical protein
MSDRYNAAFINGAPLPSSESDKKAFSFDIFPANLLDNIVILKTATPDMPGDFAGGVIQINTKSIPEKNAQSISISTGYNQQTTFKDFRTYKGGKYDWLGIDDGTRGDPKGIPETKLFSADKLDQIEYAKKVNYDWSLQSKKTMPNFNLQYSLANVGKLFKKEAGSIFALTYNSTNNIFATNRREFEEQGGQGVAAPSANRFGKVSPTTSTAVELELGQQLSNTDKILDGGASNIGVESTIIDCINLQPLILRPGSVSKEMIEEVLGVKLNLDLVATKVTKAPGLLANHYAPNAKVFLTGVPSPGDGYIALSDLPTPKGAIRLASPKDNIEYAQILYESLRFGDVKGLKRIFVVPPNNQGIGLAINDRLVKAASH